MASAARLLAEQPRWPGSWKDCNAQSRRDDTCSGQGVRFSVAVHPGEGEQPGPADLHSFLPLARAGRVGISHLHHWLSVFWNPGPPTARG